MTHELPFPLHWNMTDFPQRLRQLRTARNLTQTRLAQPLEVSPAFIPAGRTAAGAPVAMLTIAEAKKALAATFGVKPDAVEITIRG